MRTICFPREMLSAVFRSQASGLCPNYVAPRSLEQLKSFILAWSAGLMRIQTLSSWLPSLVKLTKVLVLESTSVPSVEKVGSETERCTLEYEKVQTKVRIYNPAQKSVLCKEEKTCVLKSVL